VESRPYLVRRGIAAGSPNRPYCRLNAIQLTDRCGGADKSLRLPMTFKCDLTTEAASKKKFVSPFGVRVLTERVPTRSNVLKSRLAIG
jgi:hypothetical protein